MKCKRTFLRSVLIPLVLVIGPLQAQTAFACKMIEKVMVGECCCADHAALKDCINSDCDTAVDSGRDPCCDQSVAVSLDDVARQNTPIVKPAEVPPDVDPPQAIAGPFDVPIALQSLAARSEFLPQAIAGQSGSDTYLITQRLRI